MQPNMSRPVQPVKQVEEKRSKWRLFGKGTNKSTERLSEPGQRRSNASATSNESQRSSTTDESRSLVNASMNNNSPREAHPAPPSGQRSGIGADRGNSGMLLHNNAPKEVYPGLRATQAGISVEKVFQPQSVLSSSSTPSVRQETFTDPVTGEVTTKTITTVVTETTTTQITKPPMSPPIDDDLDVEEERRLATEFLAASDMRSGQGPNHGLRPPPKSRPSVNQGNERTAIPLDGSMGTVVSHSHRHSPDHDMIDRWSSEHHSPESQPSDRHGSEKENHLEQLRPHHMDPTQSPGRAAHHDIQRKTAKHNETNRKVRNSEDPNTNEGATRLTRHPQQPTETSIHAQTSYGNEPVKYAARDDEPRASDIVVPTMENARTLPGTHEDEFTQPQAVQRQASTARVRSVHPTKTLTPPLEEQEQKVTNSNKRGSWGTFGNALGAKPKPKDSLGAKANVQAENPMYGVKIGGDSGRMTDNAVARKKLAERPVNGANGGRY